MFRSARQSSLFQDVASRDRKPGRCPGQSREETRNSKASRSSDWWTPVRTSHRLIRGHWRRSRNTSRCQSVCRVPQARATIAPPDRNWRSKHGKARPLSCPGNILTAMHGTLFPDCQCFRQPRTQTFRHIYRYAQSFSMV